MELEELKKIIKQYIEENDIKEMIVEIDELYNNKKVEVIVK